MMNFDPIARALSWDRIVADVVAHVSGQNGIMLLIFWGVVIFGAVVTYFQVSPRRSLGGWVRHVLPYGTLRHPSARADMLFWLSRRIVTPLLVVPLALSTVTAGSAAHWLLVSVLGHPAPATGPAGVWMLAAFTVTMFLAYDLSYYLYHYLQHHVPFMWELHKVHHSAEVMVGVTRDRVHPLDEIMNRWWDGIIPGLAYGIWMFFALDPVELTIFGLDVYFLRNAVLMMDFVRHTHLKLSYGAVLNRILLGPHYHQLHHSTAARHWNKNFGLSLSLWDRMFGTLYVPDPGEAFVFGLPGGEAAEYQSLVQLYVRPLKKIARQLRPRMIAQAADPSTAMDR